MKNFKSLKVWQQGMLFVKLAYELRKSLPDSERFGLMDQLKRASVSIPTNIAEGSSRLSDKDFSWFLQIALGSAYEVETLLLLIKDIGYASKSELDQLPIIDEIQKMLFGLMKTLKK
ncbi:MAG: four helix bundle protein [Bacteroidia bacterium]